MIYTAVKTAFIAVAVLVISGCAQLQFATQQGAEVADGALAGGAFTICTAATVGSIRRRYGNNPEQMAAWQLFCETELNNLTPVEVPR